MGTRNYVYDVDIYWEPQRPAPRAGRTPQMAEAEYTVPVNSGSGSPPDRGAQTDDQCWNASRLEILGWLKRNAPSLAELYEGAVLLICHKSLPGWTRYLCHGIREIGNELPDRITGTTSGMQLQLTNRFDEILNEWRRANLPLDGTTPGVQVTAGASLPSPSNIELPRRIYDLMAEVVRDHEESRQRRRQATTRMFETLIPEERNRDAFGPVIRQWRDVVHWFVGHAHDGEWQDSDLDEGELQRHFELFELTLASIVRQFFTTSKDIDDILENAKS